MIETHRTFSFRERWRSPERLLAVCLSAVLLQAAALLTPGVAAAQQATKDLSTWPVNEPLYVAALCGESINPPSDYAELLQLAIRQLIDDARNNRNVVVGEKEAFELIRRRTCPTPELQPRKRTR